MATYTIILPYVAPEVSTQWHPTVAVGPFSTLQRGNFTTQADAVAWARKNLNGAPYTIKQIEARHICSAMWSLNGECDPQCPAYDSHTQQE
jgi:hypothetical protein